MLELRESVSRPGSESSAGGYSISQDTEKDARSLKELEVEAIIRSLHRWEETEPGLQEELGISRRTLINKIAEYQLDL